MEVLLGLCVLAGFKLTALSLMSNRRKKVYVGTLSAINVFPVKSGQRLKNVNHATLDKHGLYVQGIGDRHWMVTRNGERMNMNRIPRIAQIKTSTQGGNLRLDSDGHEPLILPADPEVNQEDVITLKFSTVPQVALDCGDKAAAWLCKVLEKENVRLNHSSSKLEKRLACHSAVERAWQTEIQPHDEVSFQDFSSCMIMTNSSMDELNKRLEKKIDAVQLRPSLMVNGSQPFDEENWKYVYIGETAALRFVDMCQRCLLVTRDPYTGALDKGEQPLKELKQFQCHEAFGPHKPVMGIHTVYEVGGDIKIGDPVYVIRK